MSPKGIEAIISALLFIKSLKLTIDNIYETLHIDDAIQELKGEKDTNCHHCPSAHPLPENIGAAQLVFRYLRLN